MEEKWITICYYSSEPNRGAGTFINFDEKFPDLPSVQPLFCSILLMPLRLFGPALLFGTLEYSVF